MSHMTQESHAAAGLIRRVAGRSPARNDAGDRGLPEKTRASAPSGAKDTFANLPAAKRRRVMRAALAEFSSHDYVAANLDRIARSARVPKGSLYQYFNDKAGLFAHVVRAGLDEAFQIFSAFLVCEKPQDLWETLLIVLTFVPRLHDKRPDLAGLYVRVGFMVATEARDVGLPHLQRIGYGFTASLVDRAIANGDIRANVDREAATFLIDAVTQEFHRSSLLPGGALAGRSRKAQRRQADAVVGLLKLAIGQTKRNTR